MGKLLLPTPQRLRCAGNTALTLLEQCFDQTPEHWRFQAWQSPDELPKSNRLQVSSHLAEMAFWKKVALPNAELDCPQWLLQSKPFPDAVESLEKLLPLAELTGMAVMPLAGREGQQPLLARLYLLPKKLPHDARDRLSFTNTLPNECSVLLGMANTDNGSAAIDGDSWQLAAAMAKTAATETGLRLKLGAGWVCTGAVNDRGLVRQIKLDNKAALVKKTARRWLLPEGDNFNQWCQQTRRNNEDVGVLSVTEALTHVRGQGILEHQFVFPTKVGELHLLLGGSLLPVVSVSLQIFPRCLCLWYSSKTFAYAKLLAEVLSPLMAVELLHMPSDNMATAEVRMRERLQKNTRQMRLLNFTGGNRLMGFAAMLAARHCQVSMVYRDVDAPNDQLEMIDFAKEPELLPKTGKINGNNCPLKWRQKVNWEKVYTQDEKKLGANKRQWLKKIIGNDFAD